MSSGRRHIVHGAGCGGLVLGRISPVGGELALKKTKPVLQLSALVVDVGVGCAFLMGDLLETVSNLDDLVSDGFGVHESSRFARLEVPAAETRQTQPDRWQSVDGQRRR